MMKIVIDGKHPVETKVNEGDITILYNPNNRQEKQYLVIGYEEGVIILKFLYGTRKK